jgi:glucuronyl/N-acetylglucosaminyl transferase EXT2
MMVVKPGLILPLYRKFFAILSVFLSLFLLSSLLVHFIPNSLYDRGKDKYYPISLHNLNQAPEVVVVKDASVSPPRNPQCSYWDCFNVYRCGNKGEFFSLFI